MCRSGTGAGPPTIFDTTDARNGSKILSLQHPYHHHHHPNAGSTLEGRTIEYRPGGGLDYHNSPLMAEIPTGDYSHIHRSIDQLRSMNERGVLGQLNALQHAAAAVGNSTDLRSALVHDYKPYISDLRAQTTNDRLIDYAADPLRLVEDHKPPHYSAPSTPPTPLAIVETQMVEPGKVRASVSAGTTHSWNSRLKTPIARGRPLRCLP
ncbi:hypothetical protein ZHAS_00010105 [Anopheles sinensis]|uniref:Uncharacterized protein n=1 Tax=Anopheles sinensis TaxID=74873 RepID=A0A084VWR6_ANOSI|nr:hypothetical protein ZHAS_00010105 [Anopheles sinensis]